LLGKQANKAKLLNKLSVSELAELSSLSKSYISQVKQGKRPPSQKLISALSHKLNEKKVDYLQLFLQSRQVTNVSVSTLKLYRFILEKFLSEVDPLRANRAVIQRYLLSIPAKGISLGNRHAHYRVIKTFFRWLENEHGTVSPMQGIRAPLLPKLICPSLNKAQVLYLIEEVDNLRDKAMIALFTESGLRLSELTNIKFQDIDWSNVVIKVLGKGRKEAYAPFGELTEKYLKEWLTLYTPNGNIWGINKNGIQTILRRLQEKTGLPCNPHTFRRTFACLLRKAGVDTMTIKDLGRWESLEMVQRYTRSVSFHDSLKFYKAPLS